MDWRGLYGPLIPRGFLSNVFNPKLVLFFCFRRANIRWARARSSGLSCPDGGLRGDLPGHSHHRAYGDCAACGTNCALGCCKDRTRI